MLAIKKKELLSHFIGDEIEDYNRLIEQVGEFDAERYIKDLIKANLKKIVLLFILNNINMDENFCFV